MPELAEKKAKEREKRQRKRAKQKKKKEEAKLEAEQQHLLDENAAQKERRKNLIPVNADLGAALTRLVMHPRDRGASPESNTP